MAYKKPTLEETFIEVLLKKGTLPSSSLFDLADQYKKDEFDTIELLTSVGFNNEAVPRIRCWNKDGKRLVQISQDIIVINQTKGYLRFSEVKKLFLKAINAFQNKSGKNKITSISFNTIDLLKVPKKDFSVGKYFNCDKSPLTKAINEIKGPTDLYFGGGLIQNDYSVRYERSINLNVRESSDDVNIRLQVSFENPLEDDSQIEKCIDDLEAKSYQFFESVITDETRNLMGGKN